MKEENKMINDYLPGESDVRPWGKWEVLYCGDGYIIKKIEVKPGENLSIQYHKHRNEVWTIVSGQARAKINKKELQLRKGETVYIPLGINHSIENITEEGLIFIEIQMGSILQENDIVRLSDKYGRT
jgi:mannose-6-phosphate isomerase